MLLQSKRFCQASLMESTIQNPVLLQYGTQLHDWVRQAKDDCVNDLAKLLQFQTIYKPELPNDESFCSERDAAFAHLRQTAERLGLEFRQPTDKVAVIEYGQGPETIGMLLHVDVVPAGENWSRPAFGGAVEHGIIHGRGTQDNKGPLIQTIHALAALRALNIPLKRKYRIIIGSQEEAGNWEDLDEYLELESPPEFNIVPDSDFPIINGEKGIIELKLNFGWDKHKLFDSLIEFCDMQSGQASNVVPDSARLDFSLPPMGFESLVQSLHRQLNHYLTTSPDMDGHIKIGENNSGNRRLHVFFQGKSAHASLPYDGHNAAVDALGFLRFLIRGDSDFQSYIDLLYRGSGELLGFLFDIAVAHPVLGVTTCCLTQIRMADNQGEAIFNIRYPLGITGHEIAANFEKSIKRVCLDSNSPPPRLSLLGKPLEPILVDPKANPGFINALETAYHYITGREATLKTINGTTYAKLLPNALNFGPVDLTSGEEEDLAHQADEQITIDHHLRNTLIYATALALLGTEETL